MTKESELKGEPWRRWRGGENVAESGDEVVWYVTLERTEEGIRRGTPQRLKGRMIVACGPLAGLPRDPNQKFPSEGIIFFDLQAGRILSLAEIKEFLEEKGGGETATQ